MQLGGGGASSRAGGADGLEPSLSLVLPLWMEGQFLPPPPPPAPPPPSFLTQQAEHRWKDVLTFVSPFVQCLCLLYFQ